MTAEQILADSWGFGGPDDWYGFRAPLPVTGVHVVRTRKIGNIGGVTELEHPPYLAADSRCDGPTGAGPVHVMLCEGDGWQASEDPDAKGYDRRWIYADSDNVPEEWKRPIAEALERIRERWPDRKIVFRWGGDEDADRAA